MSTPEILDWFIFGPFLVLLSIPIIKVILKILSVCNRQTDKYSLDADAPADSLSHDTYNLTYKPQIPHMLEDLSQPADMEWIWDELSHQDA